MTDVCVFKSAPWFLKVKFLRNQGLFQTQEKFQVLQFLIYFSGMAPGFLKFIEWAQIFFRMETWGKNQGCFPEPEIFLGFEIDLYFSRPWLSEFRVQIKRPIVLAQIHFVMLQTVTSYSFWDRFRNFLHKFI